MTANPSIQFVQQYREILTKDKEEELFLDWLILKENGKERQATRKLEGLILHYTPIVRKIVRKLSGYGIDEDELISEALLALVDAANRYDLFRGLRFSTYAQAWIRGVLFTYITRNYSVSNICANSTNKKLFFAMRRRIGEEIKKSGQFDMTQELVEKMAKEFNVTCDDIQAMNNILRSPYESLNAPIRGEGESDNMTKEDTLESEIISPEDNTIGNDTLNFHRSIINNALSELNERERFIYMQRALREREDIITLDELGSELGVSKERVRQIEIRAKDKFEASILKQISDMGIEAKDMFA